jgi:hypothetical protein
MAHQPFLWINCVVQIVLFTTKITKNPKGSDKNTPNFVLFVSFVVKTFFTVKLQQPNYLSHYETRQPALRQRDRLLHNRGKRREH